MNDNNNCPKCGWDEVEPWVIAMLDQGRIKVEFSCLRCWNEWVGNYRFESIDPPLTNDELAEKARKDEENAEDWDRHLAPVFDSLEPQFRPGDRVIVLGFSEDSNVPATVLADRGNIGTGGRRLYDVRIDNPSDEDGRIITLGVNDMRLVKTPDKES